MSWKPITELPPMEPMKGWSYKRSRRLLMWIPGWQDPQCGYCCMFTDGTTAWLADNTGNTPTHWMEIKPPETA